jgi:hypothetical protein
LAGSQENSCQVNSFKFFYEKMVLQNNCDIVYYMRFNMVYKVIGGMVAICSIVLVGLFISAGIGFICFHLGVGVF